MISNILALSTKSLLFSDVRTYVRFAAYFFIFALIVICLTRVSRYFSKAAKERKLIRMELGKVAEEVHLLRQEIKDSKATDSAAE